MNSNGPDTLLAELLELPTEAHKSDFVISITASVGEPERTLSSYVLTPQLESAFREAFSLVATSLEDGPNGTSKGAWLHSSFGGGKSHFMSVLTLALERHPASRAKEGLAEVIADFEERLAHRKLLVVPLNMIGAVSVESAVLGGYVKTIQAKHPGKPLPPVYLSDGLFENARQLRAQMGDDRFFAALAESGADTGWQDLAPSWTASSFDAAVAAPPESAERKQLVSALASTFFSAMVSATQTTGAGVVNIDEGLAVVSEHASSLDYDGVVYMLDELILWFATQMADDAFVKREGPKVAKLVESGTSHRPVPIITFIARQKDLRDLVGDHVPQADQLNISHILQWWEGRFDTINLEMDNLRAIIKKRLLNPKSPAAAEAVTQAFQATTGNASERVVDTLCTSTADRTEFRAVYPFSPALISAVVDLGSVLQRDRTALRVLAQLLVERRDTMRVGDLVPLGDLYDVIAEGEEPFGTEIKQYWITAQRLYKTKFRPTLLAEHQLDEATAASLPDNHRFNADDRIVKTLLLAAIVPGSSTLGELTARRLAALNHGTIRSIIPGQEHAMIVESLRRWEAEIGELKVEGDPNDPQVSIRLVSVDTEGIMRQAVSHDTTGARRRELRRLLFEAIGVEDGNGMFPTRTVVWRGTKRTVDVVFGNLADTTDLSDAALRADTNPKVVIDYPFDSERQSPKDDLARVENYLADQSPTSTICWIPQFLTQRTLADLGTYVVLDHVLAGDNFDRYASTLSAQDRPVAKQLLMSRRDGLLDRLRAALRQAYRVDEPQDSIVEPSLTSEQQFTALDPTFSPSRPVAGSLGEAFEKLVAQVLEHRYPAHPNFDLREPIRRADLTKVLSEVRRAAEHRSQRIDIPAGELRTLMSKVATPLDLGVMHEAHFVPGTTWTDFVTQKIANERPAVLTVGQLRAWTDEPIRRGMTRDVQDLVILSIAAQTDRVLMRSGAPVAGEIGQLDDAIELHTQHLPNDEVWSRASSRAGSIFGLNTSPVVTASGVAKLVNEIREKCTVHRSAVVEQESELRARYAARNLDEQANRMRTSKAARGLIERVLGEADDARLVELLADTHVPTTEAALGTAIVRAAEPLAALRRDTWSLIDAAGSLTGAFAVESGAIKQQVDAALVDDENVTSLAATLSTATESAIELMRRAAAPQPAEPTPAPDCGSTAQPSAAPAPSPTAPSPSPDTVVVDEERNEGLSTATALERLEALRMRLQSEDRPAEISVDLTWAIRKGTTES